MALIPPPFRFEMLEQWQRGSLWGEGDIAYDWEGPRGRKGYASSVTGAYYAARLSVMDRLLSMGRNGGAAVIRWITDEYWAPLGVWVIRETVREAMKTKPREYEGIQDAIAAIRGETRVKAWDKKSTLLREIKVQRTLLEFAG